LERFAFDRSRDEFLLFYGDTAFLLITLESRDTELRQGLEACERVSRSGNPRNSSNPPMQTAHSEVPLHSSLRQPNATTTMDEGGLGALLRLSPHYAVTLRKRTGLGTDARITVGRARTCDIVLAHNRVSKMHAWFERNDAGTYSVADSASSNGTFLDGQALQSGVLTPVLEWRSLQFGDVHAFLVYPVTLWNAFQRSATSLMPRGLR